MMEIPRSDGRILRNENSNSSACYKIFVGNIPIGLYDSSKIKKIFDRAGDVIDIFFSKKPQNNPNGNVTYAIITYSSKGEADTAIKLFDGMNIGSEFELKVRYSNKNESNLSQKFESDKYFSANLDKTMREHVCMKCGSPASFRCSICKGATYCSESCQMNHWILHKSKCFGNKNNGDLKIPPKNIKTRYQIKLEKGTEYSLGVSFVNGLNDFYCVISDQSTAEKLDSITLALESTENKDGIEQNDHNFSVGSLCSAPFSDGCRYRAVIMSLLPDHKCEVFFIDFGNEYIVEISDLRAIDLVDYVKLPGQAVRCKFSDPSYFAKEFGKYIESEIAGTVIKVSVVDINEDFCVIEKRGDVCPSSLSVIPPTILVCGESYHVIVSSVVNSKKFHVRLDDPLARCVNNKLLTRYMNEIYERSVDLHFECKTNENVAFMFNEQTWRRGLVLERLDGSPGVTLLSVDTGEVLMVPSTSVRKLDHSFLWLPASAIQCQLKSKSGSSEEELTEDLKAKKKTRRCCVINVLSHENGSYLVEFLPLNPSTTLNTKIIPNKVGPKVQNGGKCSLYYRDTQIPVSADVSAIVAHFISLEEFYIHLVREDLCHELNELMNLIQEYYSSDHDVPQSDCWSVGEPVISSFGTEGYFRALIKSVKGDMAEVFYVDFGNTETVALSNLRKIIPKFLEKKMFAIKCSIYEIQKYNAHNREKIVDLLNSESEEPINILVKAYAFQTHQVNIL